MLEKGLKRGKMRVIFLAEKTKNGSISGKSRFERFGLSDLAQQIVGAFILSSPFAVTEEVWALANSLDPLKMVIMIFFTILVSALIFYYTNFQRIAVEEISRFHVPKRLLSLFIVSYSSAFFILWLFGVIGQVTDPFWISKLVVFVGFFSSIGAAAADVLK